MQRISCSIVGGCSDGYLVVGKRLEHVRRCRLGWWGRGSNSREADGRTTSIDNLHDVDGLDDMHDGRIVGGMGFLLLQMLVRLLVLM